MAPIAILKELLNETMVRTALVSEDEQMTQPQKHREREHAHLVERAEALSVLIYILEN